MSRMFNVKKKALASSFVFFSITPTKSIDPLGLLATSSNAESHNGDVAGLALSQSGIVSGGTDGKVKLWNADIVGKSLNLTTEEQLLHEVYDVQASLDGSMVAVGEGGWQGGPLGDTFHVFESDLTLRASSTPGGFVYSVAISPDDSKVAGAGFGNTLYEYTTTMTDLLTETNIGKRTDALRYSDDGSFILSASIQTGKITWWEWDQTAGSYSSVYEVGPDPSTWSFPMDFRHGLLASAKGSGNIIGWDDPLMSPLFDENLDIGSIGAVAISPDGTNGLKIAVGGSTGVIKVVDIDGAVLFEGSHGSSSIEAIEWVDYEHIVSGASDGTIKLWSQTTTGTPPTTAPPQQGCEGLIDTKGATFCSSKLSWCPHNGGSTVQCDLTCCCDEDSLRTGC